MEDRDDRERDDRKRWQIKGKGRDDGERDGREIGNKEIIEKDDRGRKRW